MRQNHSALLRHPAGSACGTAPGALIFTAAALILAVVSSACQYRNGAGRPQLVDFYCFGQRLESQLRFMVGIQNKTAKFSMWAFLVSHHIQVAHKSVTAPTAHSRRPAARPLSHNRPAMKPSKQGLPRLRGAKPMPPFYAISGVCALPVPSRDTPTSPVISLPDTEEMRTANSAVLVPCTITCRNTHEFQNVFDNYCRGRGLTTADCSAAGQVHFARAARRCHLKQGGYRLQIKNVRRRRLFPIS